MTHQDSVPPLVREAHERAERLGFELSCEPFVGELLAALAAAVPRGGRILELGTGAGVSLAWLVTGLGERRDVSVVSVDVDAALLADVRTSDWPEGVELVEGDGAEEVDRLGDFDLVFPDAPGGKLTNLEGSIAALRPGGVLLVDDMDLELHRDDGLYDALVAVRQHLHDDPRLRTVELPLSSGVILAVRGSAGSRTKRGRPTSR